MKKLYALLLFTSVTLFAQPIINTPIPVSLCDQNQDNIEVYDLTQGIPQILGTLSPEEHTVTFHQTNSDAQNGFSPIPFVMSYVVTGNQVVWVRVVENSQPNVGSVVPFQFTLVPTVTGSVSGGGTICVNNEAVVTFTGTGGQAPYAFTYTMNGGFPQTVSSTAQNTATITIPATIVGTFSVELMDVTDSLNNQCVTFQNQAVIYNVVGGTNVTISGENQFCQYSDGTLTLTFNGGEAPYTASYGMNGVLITTAQSNTNIVTIPINTQTPGTYIYQIMSATANGCEQFQGVEYLVVINPAPFAVQAPDLVVEDESPFDGVALFDFSGQEAIYTQGIPDSFVTFYLTEADAAAGVNAILSPYFNISNPQQIWARVQSSGSGCYYLDPFNLIVTPPGTDAIFIPDTNLKAALVAANPSVNTAMNAQNQNITVDTNGDGEIQISEANQVVTLQVNGLGINMMEGIRFFYSLESLYCQDNTLQGLDITYMPWLKIVQAGNNPQLGSIMLSGCTGLENLYVENGLLTFLYAQECTNLAILSCYSNSISDLQVSGLQNLQMLNCDLNQLTTLNLSGLTSLTDLSCNLNQIASLDVSTLGSLSALSASSNQLTTIDVSENNNLIFLNVEANNLETVLMKNGSNEEFLFGGNPNLSYICADLSQIEAIEASINFNENILVTPYCTDEPGGAHNTIFGTVRFDGNNNGCDTQDLAQPFTKVRITDGGSEGFVFLNSELEYIFHTGAGNFEVSPDLENSTLFTVTPAIAGVSFADIANNVSINNFCLTANGTSHDVEVVLAPLGVARPGFDAYYQIVVRNKGNQVESGTATFNFNDAITDFVSSAPDPSTQATGVISFNYSNLNPFEIRVMNIILNVNAPTETPAVNIGDILTFSVSATLSGTDIVPADNQMGFDQTVVGAYDPNDKQCVEGDVVSPAEIGKYLHYVINFENTGNFPAENVVVRDVIDTSKFDLSSLQVINASHAVTARVVGNNVEFFFKNINLGIGGHGNILLKIKTLETLLEGDIVTNKADIFFDYNYPIETNTAATAFQALSIPGFDIAGLLVSPNPSVGLFTVKAAQEIQVLELYDFAGRLLQVSRPDSAAAQMDLTQRQAGLYLLKVSTAGQTATLKLLNR